MKLFKSKAGFTLIELLVVIGILAVLAAIAIPSVAGLIDRANVSADKTNANEMTNAIERFTSEYELYCQDIASGALDENNLDSAQGRVKNIIGVTTRSGIEGIEFAQSATVADNVVAIYRDTKYPMNAYTMQKIVENYTKTSSSTFEPKQSDMHFWYSPDCGVVVVAEPNKTAAELDKYVISGMDAKGNDITSDSVNAQWIDLTNSTVINDTTDDTTDETSQYKLNGTWILNRTIDTGMQHNFKQDIQFTTSGGAQFYSMGITHAGSEADWFQYYYYDSTVNNGAGAYMASTVYEYRWFSEGYRTVDFGNNYQEVSQEFYNWFVANATEDFEGCFVAGSQVSMADGTTKNIEDVVIGDRVVSYNRHTNNFYVTNVIGTTIEDSSCYFTITLDDGTEVNATGNHPFLTDKGYENIAGRSEETVIVDVLNVGDRVMTTEGYKTIVSIDRVNKKTKVYNLNVADDDEIKDGEDNDEEDTFIVEGVVNHNHSGGAA